MLIVKIIYTASLDEVDKYLKAHRDFLDTYYKQNLFLASGPMTPREGGVLLVKGHDKEALEAILEKDPFHLAGIARYEIIEFQPVKYQDEINAFL